MKLQSHSSPMALEEEQEMQNAPFCMLFCEEDSSGFEDDSCDKSDEKFPYFHLGFLDRDMFWDEDELSSLISKENELKPSVLDDEFLSLCREKAVDWILRVKSHYGFSSLTVLLAVNYFDRFITSRKFQTEFPWMSQLTALACLSLAAKVEEVQVPLLLDLQVEEASYVFEAKTIQRMELLILSTLQWRMHPVTPISFIDHIIRRFSLQFEFSSRCESLLLNIVPDSRFLSFSPSVLATAIMVSVFRSFKACDDDEYESQLMTLLKVDSEKVNKCYELVFDHIPSKIRMQPSSPTGVFDASFNSDSSNESWVVSASPSPEPLFKRRRVQEQQMKLSSINSVSRCVFY